MKARAKEKLENRLSRVWLKAKEIDFKTPEEYILFEELRKKDVEVGTTSTFSARRSTSTYRPN